MSTVPPSGEAPDNLYTQLKQGTKDASRFSFLAAIVFPSMIDPNLLPVPDPNDNDDVYFKAWLINTRLQLLQDVKGLAKRGTCFRVVILNREDPDQASFFRILPKRISYCGFYNDLVKELHGLVLTEQLRSQISGELNEFHLFGQFKRPELWKRRQCNECPDWPNLFQNYPYSKPAIILKAISEGYQQKTPYQIVKQELAIHGNSPCFQQQGEVYNFQESDVKLVTQYLDERKKAKKAKRDRTDEEQQGDVKKPKV